MDTNLLVYIKSLLLAISAFLGISFEVPNLGGISPEPIYAVIKGKELTETKYKELKTELKGKMANRKITKINNVDFDKWIEVVNLEIKKCVLVNVNKVDVDLINNNCLN